MKCPKCNFENPDTQRFCGDCGTQFPPADEISAPLTETLETPKEELTTGSTFAGRYQIIEELGKGGMGKVYKAQDTDLKEKVAIKLLRPEIASDKKTIERFRNELKFARKIRHKNVCQMYDLNKEKGLHYITMEYVPGEDLKSMIRMMGQLSSGKTIFIAKQVCEGLAEAHRLGVVHRDLKPQNIMIDRDGNARIMDFGIARSLKTKGITAAGVMIGTPEYMSPEQVEGKEVDQLSDIYSLGVILYEMVTGRVPFEGDTPFTIGVKHKSEKPKDPKEFNTQLPEDLNLVILRCLEKDKEKRYQRAGEVRAELTRIEKGIPTTEIEIPKRKPLTSREITVTFGLKKLLIPAIVVVALIIAAIAIWQLLPKKEIAPIPSDKPSLAVLYFENNTGDESLDHWRKMFSDLLITDLTQSKHLRILSGDRLFKILKDINQLETKTFSADVLKEVADRGRVRHLLLGKYARMGDTFRIDTVLQEAGTGEIVSSLRVEARGEEEIFPKIDELTRKIKANFEFSPEEIASDIDKEVGKITTSSPEAYRYYSEGKKSYDRGDERKSIQFYEKAVALDPEFATAYKDMAVSYYNLGLYSEEKKYLLKALALGDRVSDRERYLSEAEFYAHSEKTYDKSIEAFNKLLEHYPEDVDGNGDLGWVYMQLEQWDKAIERYKVNVQNKVEEVYTHANLASLYEAKGLYDKAKDVLEYYLNNYSDNSYIRWSLADNYLSQGKYDLALVEADKAFFLNPADYYNFSSKGDIYLCQGDLIKAEEEYQKLLNSKEPVDYNWGLVGLSLLNLLQGKFEKAESLDKQGIEFANKVGENVWRSRWHLFAARHYLRSGNPEHALKECDEAWNIAEEADYLSGQRRALYSKGLVFLEMKSMDEAQRAAADLKEMIEKGMNKKLMRFYYNLTGWIELERGNFSKAIKYFNEALSLLSYGPLTKRADFIDSLALAYYKSGDLEKARDEYERITSLTIGRLYYDDIYAKSFYMLGKIYEEQGQKAKAIEHYEKFLGLWKDADPGIAEIEDAKKRLAGLQTK
jgi:serine/threonine protein kinase/Tfp pilus assembly protein PilF